MERDRKQIRPKEVFMSLDIFEGIYLWKEEEIKKKFKRQFAK